MDSGLLNGGRRRDCFTDGVPPSSYCKTIRHGLAECQLFFFAASSDEAAVRDRLHLDVWHGEDYQRHWAEAAARIAAGADRTAFFSSAFEFRWTMWRLGSELRVQEYYLAAEGFPEEFDPSDLYGGIRDYTDECEGGGVSEWIVPFEAVAEFARRAED